MIGADSSAAPVVSGSDERLIRECIDGDQSAWRSLVDKYRNLIFSVPIKLGLSPDDAAEVFQNVCMTLITQLSRIREPKSLPAWLIQVAAHESFRWKKKNAVYESMDLDECGLDLALSGKLADAMIQELEREQILRETVSELADRCKELVRMLFFTNPAMPYEAVAAELGIATSSVGFVRMRCLQRLRRQLEQKGFR
jgi:RNA polymerase sigma factor (sigma-70 family)